MSDRNTPVDQYVQEKGMADLWNVWYSELHDHTSGLTLKVNRTVESLESEFQRIDVIENDDFGKLLVLYGSLMACDNDNNAYNEMITHVPLFSHPCPGEVLIIGGGDCGALTEVLKHPEVKRCTMCEIDGKVVETARKHFPHLTRGLDDPRAKLVIGNGKEMIEKGTEKYDIILLDLSDPVGPAADLFQKKFHQDVYGRLNDDGIMVAQSESPYYNKQTVRSMYTNLRGVFPVVKMYTCFMPIYPSGLWSFAFCSKGIDPLADFDRKRCDQLQLETQYYNAETHLAAFALPRFVKELVDR
jgi:spermidine synthase